MTDNRTNEHECLFPEEQEPSGRLILAPCLTCGTSAVDAISKLKSDCPVASNHTYKNRGAVVECVHGNVFMVYVDYIGFGWRGREGFIRLSPFWNPIRYKRARTALGVEKAKTVAQELISKFKGMSLEQAIDVLREVAKIVLKS